MPEITELRPETPKSDTSVGVKAPNSDTKNRTERLRAAIRSAGGNKVVVARTGIPKTTLDGYLGGGEMKLSNAVALAEATGVRLEWLATGEGPMRAGELPAAPPPAPPAPPAAEPPFRLFGKVKIDRLVDAYEGALASTRGADKRLTMHLTVLLYDQLADAQEGEAPASTTR